MPTESLRAEVFGMTYDPAFAKWGAVLGLAELVTYAEYAHWHLVSALEQPGLQGGGWRVCCYMWLR
jgi:hypothetical protein